MLFPTGAFVAFFLAVFILNWLLMRHQFVWKLFMLVAGYVFYVGWGWRFAILLAGTTAVTYAFGWALSRAGAESAGARRRKWLLAAAIVLVLTPLMVYKYYGFLAFNLARLFGNPVGLLQLAIPIGISFTTFRAISHLVDTYRGEVDRPPFLDFAVYMSFFPYMAAGPIVRSRELLPQFRRRTELRVDSARAFYLIGVGLVKKVVIADFVARAIVDPVFAVPGQYSSLQVVIAIHAYAVQIYCDFSGYTDMAIGVALLLGFELPDNFDRPYTATSVRDFWRRWHITLSRWIRDYLYIPLGGNRRGVRRTYANLLIAMVLAGLWHGAGWTFLFWGLLYGLALALEHRLAALRRRRGIEAPTPRGFALFWRRLLTFEFVVFAWIFFRAESMERAGSIIARTFTSWDYVGSVDWLVLVAIAAGIGLQYFPAPKVERLVEGLSRRQPIFQALALGLVLFAIVGLLGAEGLANFIYIGF
ncbi:MAG: MBOAT family protein [Thermoleophilia bacterium]|nr:MBOAT family protein [Thermoleophilia bacterium]